MKWRIFLNKIFQIKVLLIISCKLVELEFSSWMNKETRSLADRRRPWRLARRKIWDFATRGDDSRQIYDDFRLSLPLPSLLSGNTSTLVGLHDSGKSRGKIGNWRYVIGVVKSIRADLPCLSRFWLFIIETLISGENKYSPEIWCFFSPYSVTFIILSKSDQFI